MTVYNGIKPKGLFLLADNKIQDNKSFYESIKPELEKEVLLPLRQIAEALLEDMYAIDSQMQLNPRRMVSRIRRDTRRSKTKHMYRDNVWIRFGRPKAEDSFTPEFWFGIDQTEFSYGVGQYYTPAKFMQGFRNQMLEKPKKMESIAKKIEKAGFSFIGDRYVKEKEGDIPISLKTYYQLKNPSAALWRTDFKVLESQRIIEDLREAFHQLSDLYLWLLETPKFIED